MPEGGVEQLLGILMGGEKCDFEICAKLRLVDFPLFKSALHHVDQEFILGIHRLFVRNLSRPVSYQIEQKIFKLPHDRECTPARRKYHGVPVQGGKVEKQRFKYRPLDDALQNFYAHAGIFQALQFFGAVSSGIPLVQIGIVAN